LGAFVATVRPRWSDMDAYGHVNHANTVTLREEARLQLVFGEAARHGAGTMADGMVVARLVVDYHAPLVVDGGSVRVELTVRELRAASFCIDYVVHSGLDSSDAVVATAETMMVPYDVGTKRPRRVTEAEREFLITYQAPVRSA
jgi:acyl-CoA thioester hydrolase